MGSRARCVLVAASVVASGGGCSLVLSTEGYSGERPAPVSTVDASSPSPPEGDGGARPDGGASARFCDGLATGTKLVCTDFDGPSPLAGWGVDGDGEVVVDQASSRSPSSSLLARTVPISDGRAATASILFDTAPRDRLRATWSMQREPTPSCGGMNTAGLFYTDGAKYFILQVQLDSDDGIGFQEYGVPGPNGKPEYSNGSTTSVPSIAGQWIRVAMAVDLKASGGPTVNIMINDTQPLLSDFKLVGGVGLGPLTGASYRAGITFVGGPSGECRLRFDDVALETY